LGDVSSIVIDEEVNFMSLIVYFKKECGYALEGWHRRWAIMLCLLGAFLFAGLLIVEVLLHSSRWRMAFAMAVFPCLLC